MGVADGVGLHLSPPIPIKIIGPVITRFCDRVMFHPAVPIWLADPVIQIWPAWFSSNGTTLL
jgi:hypothetical protein